MQEPGKLVPAVWGGIVIGILGSVPVVNLINCACCAGTILGGVLAAYLLRRDTDPQLDLMMGDGAMVGILAGVFGAVIGTTLSSLIGTYNMEFIQKMAEFADDPDVAELLQNFQGSVFTRGFMMIGFLISLVLDTLFGLLGGLIGVALFGKSKIRPDLGGQPPESQPQG